MKRILISLATITLVAGVVVAVTGAWFSDEEESLGNTLTAGTLDLESIGTFAWGDVAPSDVNTESFDLENSGTIDAASVFLELDVVDTTESVNEPECVAEGGAWVLGACVGNVAIDDISTQIEITAMDYTGSAGTVSILGLYSDLNLNLYLDLDDLNAAAEVEINGADVLSAGEIATVDIEMTLRSDTDNEYQSDRSTVDELARITQD